MSRVLKYPILRDRAIEVPGMPLHVGIDGQDQICVWSQVIDNDEDKVHVALFPTGVELPDDKCLIHINTFIVAGWMVLHAYEVHELVECGGEGS